MNLILITLAASFFATFFATLAGGGGGLILLPILILTGLPYPAALSIHKIAMTTMGFGSGLRYWREKLIDWPTFIWSALIGLPLVVVGAYFATKIPGEAIKPLIGLLVLLIIIINLIKKPGIHKGQYKKLNLKTGFIGSLFMSPIALYSGAIGGGSGLFTTFVYLYYFKYSQLRANAMTMASNGLFWNGVGAVTLMFLGHTMWNLVPGMIIGSITGSYLGAHIGIKAGNKWVRIFFLTAAGITGLILLKPAIGL